MLLLPHCVEVPLLQRQQLVLLMGCISEQGLHVLLVQLCLLAYALVQAASVCTQEDAHDLQSKADIHKVMA
jgi:hypothetical protein